jgi:hypothetical protein
MFEEVSNQDRNRTSGREVNWPLDNPLPSRGFISLVGEHINRKVWNHGLVPDLSHITFGISTALIRYLATISTVFSGYYCALSQGPW